MFETNLKKTTRNNFLFLSIKIFISTIVVISDAASILQSCSTSTLFSTNSTPVDSVYLVVY